MKILKLKSQLQGELRNAVEVSIASAIVSDAGLEFLLSNIGSNTKLRLLIGIDLATPDTVFAKLLSLGNSNVKARVFTKQGFFHPKLYLTSGAVKAVFIGSGNFTEGGLNRNIELFHKLTDEHVFTDYQNWFNQYFNLGSEITKEWLKEYSQLYKERSEFEAEDGRSVGNFKRKMSGVKPILDLRKIDFTNQFFKLHHYIAFEGDKVKSRDKEVVQERMQVCERFLELHEILEPHIKSKGWDLHPHSMKQHITSSFQHGEFTGDRLSAVWLHYGRSQKELDKFKDIFGDKQSSLYHMRLQVVIHVDMISVWLRVGKNGGSIVDRDFFKRNMKNQAYREDFFKLLSSLPEDFFITINDDYKGVGSFNDANELYEFVRHDDINNHYFIIGKDYQPDAGEFSERNITATVINDFEKLLPLYNMIKSNI